MSTSNSGPQGNNPSVPVTSGSDEVAEQFLEHEVVTARKSLRLTQILGSIGILTILGYMIYLNTTLARTLEPKAAAEVARGLVMERVDAHANDIAAQIKTRVPAMVADVPDYALKQIPIYREQLETKVEADLEQYLTNNTPQLEGLVDDLLTAHKDEIKQVLADGKDPAVAKALGDAMEKEMMAKLAQIQINGESLQNKIGQSLDTLLKMQARIHRLATAKDLTPQEVKARRAIAILTQTVESKRAEVTPAL